MIESLLIANRGEIACRIIRTAREMGIRTVAVYSDADARALHVRMADEAVHIGPSPAAESYLRGDTIIAAARATGAAAIHPGYGFLSENAGFAQAVIDAGLVWVGPRPASIEAMGLKDAAKKLMRAANVPVTPGYEGEDQSAERLAAEADAIGYPVLIKAVAGGGGKGMRRVDAPADFATALESCRREAQASFGNDDVLLEKWITSPRHIEVQVFGDAHGNVVHLFERDCSLQRRHQKVIEEAPAPGMDEATREAICAAAVRAAKAVDYEGAGTVEFIADATGGLRADRIFFMEMNTRLQVEHPVTEQITGVDLVEWQLRVASGEVLPMRQEELAIHGHAIEARLYAEDPAKGFLPSTGRLDHLDLLAREGGFPFRVDSGVEEGDSISPYYDPMIAKLIATAQDRYDAIQDLKHMLDSSAAWPVRTNAGFLYRCLDTEAFEQGAVTTGFIEQQGDAVLPPTEPADRLWEMAAGDVHAEWMWRNGLTEGESPWNRAAGFRLNAASRNTITLRSGQQVRSVPLDSPNADSLLPRARVAGGPLLMIVNAQPYPFELARDEGGSGGGGNGGRGAHDGDIIAPMPGKVIAVDVAQGDRVEAGQRLMVLEAMKMEHALTAPFAGTVDTLAASLGAQVQVEQLLAHVEKDVEKGGEKGGEKPVEKEAG